MLTIKVSFICNHVMILFDEVFLFWLLLVEVWAPCDFIFFSSKNSFERSLTLLFPLPENFVFALSLSSYIKAQSLLVSSDVSILGLAPTMQLNPQECSCCGGRFKQSGDFLLAGNSLGIGFHPSNPHPHPTIPHPFLSDISWSHKSSAITEEK